MGELTKVELQKKLRDIENKEAKDRKNKQKEENYKKFKDRESDWMVGKAHIDMTFIGEKYASDRLEPMIPCSVKVSGNCGTTYYPTAHLTSATKMYFHNVWEQKHESGFQKRLNEFVQKEIEAIANDLTVKLEMLGLQTRVNCKNTFPENKIDDVEKDLDLARKEVLDCYSDNDFLALIIVQGGWYNIETKEPIPAFKDVRLSHGGQILGEYIAKHRPSLWPRFLECERFKKEKP